MKTIAAFLRLIRWPNLFFIVLTQLLFYYCIFYSTLIYPYNKPVHLFWLLILASVLIAAAGYIINDYFDMHIDKVNKPEKVVVDKMVKRRWAIVWHLILSFAGIVISLYISYRTGIWLISIANFACVLLLWFYSTTFKKKLLSGNLIISALTAWVILVVYFFTGAGLGMSGWVTQEYVFDVRRFFKLTMLYAGFAFVVSLIREVVKDLEDMEGDAKYACRTMPLVWGVPAAKVFAAVWMVVCIAAMTIVQLYAWQVGWWESVVYCIALIILPMIYMLRKLYTAISPADYHHISSLVKMIMLTGILSMLFFRFFPSL